MKFEKAKKQCKGIVAGVVHMGKKVADCVQNYVLFTFLALKMALKEDTSRVGKTKNQLTYIHAPSSGKIMN